MTRSNAGDRRTPLSVLISQEANPNGIKRTKWDMKIDDWAIPAPGQQCLNRQSSGPE